MKSSKMVGTNSRDVRFPSREVNCGEEAHAMKPYSALQRGRTMAVKPPHDGERPLPADPITRCLRLVYSEVASEPLPDELARLLKELEASDEGPPDG
jgi:hypothetical protein